jgi:hypothetical protein
MHSSSADENSKGQIVSGITASLEAPARPRPPIRSNGNRRESFKQIDCADLRRLCQELSPSGLKVWLYHFSRSGPAGTSFAKLETIAEGTGQNLQTVKLSRKQLVETKWLVKKGHQRLGGRLSVPIFLCAFPPPQRPGPRRVEFPPTVSSTEGGISTPARWVENPPAEVDFKIFEVDGTGSDHRFSLNYPKPTTALPPQTIKGKKQTARTVLIEEYGLDSDLVDVALLRVADLARALKKSPHSVAYFIASVKNSLADPDEAEQCRSIAAERRRSGLPIDAPLRPDEWHVRSRIALIHESVEVGVRDGRDAREVQAEMIAAVVGGSRR